MNNRQKFEYLDDVEATWQIIDTLSRMVWERDSLPLERKTEIQKAARDLHTAMVSASHDLPRKESGQISTPPRGANVEAGWGTGGWRHFTVDRLARLVITKDIGSVAETFLKATPALEAIRGTVNDSSAGFLFRGQRSINWPLVPTLGRDRGFLDFVSKADPKEFVEGRRTKTSSFELQAINDFRARWDKIGHVDPIDKRDIRPDHDPSWWFRMQHYDEEGPGTRLLDLTSSIPAALLFACLDWSTGSIDDSDDGVLYLFNEGGNAIPIDFNSSIEAYSSDDLFTGFHDVPVFFLNPPHNERSKAQSGAFLWWPRFWKPFPSQILYLRVPKENKRTIVKDLLLLNFGPKDIVRGEQGLKNERSLRKSLSL